MYSTDLYQVFNIPIFGNESIGRIVSAGGTQHCQHGSNLLLFLFELFNFFNVMLFWPISITPGANMHKGLSSIEITTHTTPSFLFSVGPDLDLSA